MGDWDFRRLHLLVEGQTEEEVARTVFLDYYGFPPDAPGMDDRPTGPAIERVCHVESRLAVEVGDQRFVPHLVLHETEAWVFAAGQQLADFRGEPALAAVLAREVKAAGGAEQINDGPATAPSKRLLGHRPDYLKVVEGPLAIADMGVAGLRKACPHADAWLSRLESLAR